MSKKTTKSNDLKVESIILADQVIEAKDNKKSVIGIFNQIFVEKLPSIHPAMTLFVTLVGEGKLERQVNLQILAPSGEAKFNKDFVIKMSDNGRSDLLMTFNSLPLEEAGEYDFVLTSDDLRLASYQLLVVMLRRSSDVVN